MNEQSPKRGFVAGLSLISASLFLTLSGCVIEPSNMPRIVPGQQGLQLNFPFPEGWCTGAYDNTPFNMPRTGLKMAFRCYEVERSARSRLAMQWSKIPGHAKSGCVEDAQSEMRQLEATNPDAKRTRNFYGYYNAYSLSTVEKCIAKRLGWPQPPDMKTL